MTVDTATQDMLHNWGTRWISITAELIHDAKDALIEAYQLQYDWTIEDCEEFLQNVSLAYELLIKGKAA